MPSSRQVGRTLVLGVAAPERVLGLQRGDRVDGVRPADRLRRRPRRGRGSAPCPARTSSAIAPTVSSIGVVGIDPVLVVEVDRLDAEPLEAAPRRPARTYSGRAVDAERTRRPASRTLPNLVASTTRSRRPRDGAADQLLVACRRRTCRRCRGTSPRARARGGWWRSTPPRPGRRRTPTSPCSRGRGPRR